MKSTSPTSDKRACLCKNGKYSKKCCKGKTINQGIGTLEEQGNSVITHQNSSRNIISQVKKEQGIGSS